MSPALLSHNNSIRNEENDIIMKWWGEFYNETSKSRDDLPRMDDDSATLHNLKLVVLLLIGVVGAIIVGCLLFCMLYKNERVLQTIPGTKEYKGRKKEPESFYPIPHAGIIGGNQSKSLARLGSPKSSRLKKSDIKPTIAGLYAEKISKESEEVRKHSRNTKDSDVLQVEGDRSDGSSLHESDGIEEFDASDNIFPSDGEMEAMKTKENRKKKKLKGSRRLRKKNKFSTTTFTKGAAPNAEEPPTANDEDDVIERNDVTYMSRF